MTAATAEENATLVWSLIL